ncbi:SRPBCC domain-containing protein [Actinokineospora spheciospongiae]|uniref:SRPBCC domain-containing protein n=1 Tax=Actinokineospora spheciospongiae TaxID=909613 RepID=UPI000D7094CA|nr:SRPBCC domain-containing protein [Actinokineospora spheciospongiae]PWW60349.1 activator of Hsp90 ATPase-like protein [Actinokineospora spheciospongiae]
MPTGLTRDAGWQIGVSRTVAHPLPVVWDFLSGPEGLALWLGADPAPEPGAPFRTADGVEGEVRGYRERDRIRVTHGTTTIQVAVRASGSGRTMLRFHQERMADGDERERQRAHWSSVLDAVAAALDRR